VLSGVVQRVVGKAFAVWVAAFVSRLFSYSYRSSFSLPPAFS
jgi:CRISPR/Cas system-associated protein Cas5 (RAMP superfamily)